jgi:hypothetical protein
MRKAKSIYLFSESTAKNNSLYLETMLYNWFVPNKKAVQFW